MRIYLIIGALFFCVLIICTRFARHFDKKDSNKCYCCKCNSKLKQFHYDTDWGECGYVCTKCGEIVWMSDNNDKNFDEDIETEIL